MLRFGFAGAVAALALSAFGTAASAADLWNNGFSGGDSFRCDSSAPTCGAADGWIVYDDFNLTGASVITGFTYDTNLAYGGIYSGSAWEIWNTDPAAAGSAALSGSAVGSLTSVGGFTRVTVTGLNISQAAGTRWLGLSNLVSNGGTTSYRLSGGALLGRATQTSLNRAFVFSPQGDAAFSLQGRAAVPEPASWALMLTGFFGMGSVLRGRRRAMAVA